MSESLRRLAGTAALLFILACGPLESLPTTVAPASTSVVIVGLPPGYHAEEATVFILMTAPLQTTSVLADRESLAAVAKAYPNTRVCVIGVDSESVERDVNGREWLGVLGYFCMPPAPQGKTSKSNQ